jgi:arsenite-transporting ATPase
LAEAQRTSQELSALGVANQHLLINGVFVATERGDPVAVALEARGRAALDKIPPGLACLPRATVPLAPRSPLGADGLRALLEGTPTVPHANDPREFVDLPTLAELVDALEGKGCGVIMTMGKGGVGKTTVAAAVAVALAERGHPVLLTTTDPAAHVSATVNGGLPNLTVRRIDPRAETAAYTALVMGSAGAGLDARGKALLEEDLSSPCTEEVAVFRAFAQAVAGGEDRFVVLDTAPTGHTILLLDAALAYHREVTRQASGMPESVEKLLPRLRDPDFTRVLIVTLPETTPVHEAASLQQDLIRAGIQPFAWVINQSLAALDVTDPVLRPRQTQEAKYIREVTEQQAPRTALVPWQKVPPVGTERLRMLLAGTE